MPRRQFVGRTGDKARKELNELLLRRTKKWKPKVIIHRVHKLFENPDGTLVDELFITRDDTHHSALGKALLKTRLQNIIKGKISKIGYPVEIVPKTSLKE